MKKIFLLAIAASLLASCASRPESIPASYVDSARYDGVSCNQLQSQMVNAQEELRLVSDKQDTVANVDAGTVFLALIPVSAFSGDHEAEVAEAKGKVNAIKTAQIKNKCVAQGN